MNGREDFEEWVTDTYTDLPAFEHLSKYQNGDYYHDEIIYAWEAWQHQQQRIDILLNQQDRLLAMNESLQQRLAMQQREIMRLRGALEEMVAMQELEGFSCEPQRELLSTQTTYDDLMAWYEAQLGEPVAFINVEERTFEWNGSMYWNDWYTPTVFTLPKIPLYTAPSQSQTVKDALEKAAEIALNCNYAKSLNSENIKHFNTGVGEFYEAIRALIEKD